MPDVAAEAKTTPAGKSLGRNMSSMFVAQVVTWTISLSLVVLVPRFLGPEAIGELQIAESVWSIAGVIAAFGTRTVVTLAIARDRNNGAEVIGAVLLARTATLAIVSVGVAAVAGFVYGADLAALFVVVGVGAWLLTMGEVGGAALQGFEDLSLPARASVLSKGLNAVAVILVLLLGGGIVEVAIVMTLGSALYTALVFRYVRRFGEFSWRSNFPEAVSVLKRGLPFLLGTATMVVYHAMDSIVISLLLEEEQVGWYAAADRLMTSSAFIPTTVMSALFPVLARLKHEDDAQAVRIVHESFRSLVLLAVPIGVGIILISSPFVRMLFGDDFAETGPVFAVFGVVLMIMFQTILLGQYAVAAGREKFYFALLGVATVATVPIDLVLVPWTNRTFDNGAIGGALAYVVTEGMIMIVAVRVLVPGVVDRTLLVRVTKCVVAAGVMALVVWPIREIFVLVPVTAGAIVYAVALMVLRTLDERERGIVDSVTSKLPVRSGRGGD